MRFHHLTVVVCLLAGTSPALAEEGTRGGLIGGPSAATLAVSSGTSLPDFSSRAGFSAGLFVVSPPHHGIAFEPEVLFTRRGGRAQDSDEEISFRANYVDVPLLIRFQPQQPGRVTAHLVVGPMLGIRLSAKQSFTVAGTTTTEDIKDQTRAGAFSLAAGGGIDVGRFQLGARYVWGLSRLNTDRSDGLDIKHREFTVLAGVSVW
jgi:hypothetical protein